MGIESGEQIAPLESFKELPEEQALKAIKNHIENAELDSLRWVAFSDYTDLLKAQGDRDRKARPTIDDAIRIGLIENDIRKGRNRIPGYNKEFKDIERLGNNLRYALSEGMRILTPKPEYVERIKMATTQLAEELEDIQAFVRTSRQSSPAAPQDLARLIAKHT